LPATKCFLLLLLCALPLLPNPALLNLLLLLCALALPPNLGLLSLLPAKLFRTPLMFNLLLMLLLLLLILQDSLTIPLPTFLLLLLVLQDSLAILLQTCLLLRSLLLLVFLRALTHLDRALVGGLLCGRRTLAL
jgi:energy-coupling factor transporter transmembrane protein EcfT